MHHGDQATLKRGIQSGVPRTIRLRGSGDSEIYFEFRKILVQNRSSREQVNSSALEKLARIAASPLQGGQNRQNAFHVICGLDPVLGCFLQINLR
ncbi:hypothetical protein Pla52o_48110 [Novipirellula galeiformis]|uniref:Uncharacterized protein n=1 Tax=Novipirellula galeiformis TaxID=2528004 RepID=A0A5C6C817_9BACT|nr:hypothetical protein Pla52o_48110 [Novipirellula galeiformis]